MRVRSIKPGLLKNEILGSGPIETQFLFGVLPMLADRAGILEDRPRRIKAEVFPYRPEIDMEAQLDLLMQGEFITRYESEGKKLIHISQFSKHQHPHKDEPASIYRTPLEELAKSREVRGNSGAPSEIPGPAPALILDTRSSIPGTSNPGTPNPESLPSASRGESPEVAGEGVPEFPAGLSPSGSQGSEAPDSRGEVPGGKSGEPSPSARRSAGPNASHAPTNVVIPPGVNRIAAAWAEICTMEGSPFKDISPMVLAKHAPVITENLEDPRWLQQCLDVIRWLPSSDFNAGRIPPREEGKPPFVASFGFVIKKVWSLNEDMVKDIAQKEQLAMARKKSQVTGPNQTGELLGNHLERMQRQAESKATLVESMPSIPEEQHGLEVAAEPLDSGQEYEISDPWDAKW